MNADSEKKPKFNFNLNWLKIACIAIITITALYLAWSRISGEKITNGKNFITINLYFRNAVTFEWETEARQIKTDSKGAMVGEVFKLLREGPKSPQLTKSIPDYIETESDSILTDEGVIYISFSESYNTMTATEAADLNCSLVWTLTEFDFIENVHITVANAPLIPNNENHNPVYLNRRNVGISPSIPDAYTRQKAILYFPDGQGMGLIQETREIEIDSNQPVETAILNAMIAGPNDENLTTVIPKETKVLSTKVEDLVLICYVNLSSDFIDKLEPGSTVERLAVASIVNALTERTNIKKVQILIDGDKAAQTKGHGLDFSTPFERMDGDILEKP